jgi:hypothetical protein
LAGEKLQTGFKGFVAFMKEVKLQYKLYHLYDKETHTLDPEKLVTSGILKKPLTEWDRQRYALLANAFRQMNHYSYLFNDNGGFLLSLIRVLNLHDIAGVECEAFAAFKAVAGFGVYLSGLSFGGTFMERAKAAIRIRLEAGYPDALHDQQQAMSALMLSCFVQGKISEMVSFSVKMMELDRVLGNRNRWQESVAARLTESFCSMCFQSGYFWGQLLYENSTKVSAAAIMLMKNISRLQPFNPFKLKKKKKRDGLLNILFSLCPLHATA